MYETPEGTPSGSMISLNRDSTYDSLRCPSRLSIAFLDEEKGEDEWSASVMNAVDTMATQSPPQVDVKGE
jgi:hypothetical protein